MAKVSLEKEKIKILLLEGLHPSSVEVLQAAGYTNIEYHKGSLPEDELLEALKMLTSLVSVLAPTYPKKLLMRLKSWLQSVVSVLVPTKSTFKQQQSAVSLFSMHRSQTLEVLLNSF